MSQYKKIMGAKGGAPRYLKDGKFAPVPLVPGYIKTLLEVHPSAEDWQVDKPCLFCGLASSKQRLVRRVTVALCAKHYYSETIGRITARLIELQGVQDGLEAKAWRSRQQKVKSKGKRWQLQRQNA